MNFQSRGIFVRLPGLELVRDVHVTRVFIKSGISLSGGFRVPHSARERATARAPCSSNT